MQVYVISFMRPYKQSGRCQDVLFDTVFSFVQFFFYVPMYKYQIYPAIDQTAYMDA